MLEHNRFISFQNLELELKKTNLNLQEKINNDAVIADQLQKQFVLQDEQMRKNSSQVQSLNFEIQKYNKYVRGDSK